MAQQIAMSALMTVEGTQEYKDARLNAKETQRADCGRDSAGRSSHFADCGGIRSALLADRSQIETRLASVSAR
jgi:hypothetical protein